MSLIDSDTRWGRGRDCCLPRNQAPWGQLCQDSLSVSAKASWLAFTSLCASWVDVPTSCSVILNAESMIFWRGPLSALTSGVSHRL